MIIATKDPEFDIEAELQSRAPEFAAQMYRDYEPPAGTKLFTDDFAPVDQYLLEY